MFHSGSGTSAPLDAKHAPDSVNAILSEVSERMAKSMWGAVDFGGRPGLSMSACARHTESHTGESNFRCSLCTIIEIVLAIVAMMPGFCQPLFPECSTLTLLFMAHVTTYVCYRTDVIDWLAHSEFLQPSRGPK